MRTAWRHVVLRKNRSAQLGLNAEHREVGTGDRFGEENVHAALAVDLDRGDLCPTDGAEHLFCAVAHVLEVGIRERAELEGGLMCIQVDHVGWTVNGHLAQDDRVDEAENGRVGANAQGQGENGHRGEGRASGEGA